MEDKKAFEFLYKKAIQNNHKELANHIKRIGPLKIKLSKMSFVDHLSKIVVGQQLSVKSAAAIWARTEILLKANKYKKPNEKLNIKFKKAGLSRQKIEYLNGIIFNKEIINVTKKELKTCKKILQKLKEPCDDVELAILGSLNKLIKYSESNYIK